MLIKMPFWATNPTGYPLDTRSVFGICSRENACLNNPKIQASTRQGGGKKSGRCAKDFRCGAKIR